MTVLALEHIYTKVPNRQKNYNTGNMEKQYWCWKKDKEGNYCTEKDEETGEERRQKYAVYQSECKDFPEGARLRVPQKFCDAWRGVRQRRVDHRHG